MKAAQQTKHSNGYVAPPANYNTGVLGLTSLPMTFEWKRHTHNNANPPANNRQLDLPTTDHHSPANNRP